MDRTGERTSEPVGAPPTPPAALFRSLVDDSFEFIITISADLTVAYANPAVSPLLGHDPADVVGRPITDFVHPDDLDRALTAVSGWGRWGSPAGATSFRLRHANGTWLTFDVTAAGVTDGQSDQFAVYGRPAGLGRRQQRRRFALRGWTAWTSSPRLRGGRPTSREWRSSQPPIWPRPPSLS